MAGWRETGQAAALPEHLDRYGGLPLRGGSRSDQAGGRRRTPWLADAVTEAGLTGRGGGGFPTGTKMRAVAARTGTGRGGAIVVANGVESEPASSKDEALLSLAPHLVLDGAVLAAEAVGAREVHLCLSRLRPRLSGQLQAAVAERQQARMDPVPITVHTLPRRYVASEETALIRWLNGGEAKPVLTPPRPHERGVRRLPTLVDNVETLAHIALIARYGPVWFRQAGRPDAPGTMLVTISGDVSYPGVREIELGTPVGDVLARKRDAGEIPPLVTVQTHYRVRDAVALLHEHRVSQLPVVSAHDPATVVGAIGERGLLKRAAENPAILDAEIVEVMEPPFPAVSTDDPVREAVELLVGDQQALLVTHDGRADLHVEAAVAKEAAQILGDRIADDVDDAQFLRPRQRG